MNKLFQHINRIDSRLLIVFIALCYLLISYILNEYIITKGSLIDYYSKQLNSERIDSIIRLRDKWKWLTYLAVVLIFCFKIFIISLCFQIGFLLSNIEIKFKNLFRVILIGELTFVLAGAIKIILLISMKNNDIEFIQLYYPLSLLNYIKLNESNGWLTFTLQQTNIFQLLYIVILTFSFMQYIESGFIKIFKMMLIIYGTMFFIWLLVVTYFYVIII